MILTFAIKEWKVMLRNALLVRCVLGFAVVFVLISLLGTWNYWRASRQAAELNATFVKQWMDQGKKTPHAAAHWGIPFVAAPAPLSVYDPGVEPFLGEFTPARAHEWTSFRAAKAVGSSTLERYAEMTPVWWLQYVLPLLAILLSYQMVASERVLGTARNLAAIGAEPIAIVLGKAVAAISVLAVLVTALFAILGLLLALAGGFSAELLPALAVHAALALIFASTFVWISLCCSYFSPHARTAASAMLGIWIVMCFIIPGWITDRARLEKLGPARVELDRVIEADIERGAAEYPSKDERREATLQTLLTTLRQGKKEELPLDFPLFFLMEEDEVTGILIDRRVSAPFDVFRNQDDERRSLAALSPLTAWRMVSPVMSGTDFLERVRLMDGVEKHRRRTIRILNRQHSASLLRRQPAETDQKLWGTVVPFRAEGALPLSNIGGYQREFLIMIIWSLAGAGLAIGAAFWNARQENV